MLEFTSRGFALVLYFLFFLLVAGALPAVNATLAAKQNQFVAS